MKKILSCLMLVFALGACSQSSDSKSFDGKEYKLENALNNANITIAFEAKEHRFFGKSAVNRYFGTYTQEGDKIKFGPAGSTMMMGPEPLMKAEYEFLQDLSKIESYQLSGKKLTLKTADGKELVFKQIGEIGQKEQPEAENRYTKKAKELQKSK